MRQITMKGKSASSENGDSYKSYSDNENSDHENDSPKKASGEEDAGSGGEENDDPASDVSEDESKSSKTGKKSGKRGKKKSKSDKKGKATVPKQDEEYEVQKVVGKQKIFGKVHYLIRWKGYGPDDDTWEKEDTLNCPDLIKAYLENPAKVEAEEAAQAKKRAAEQPASKAGGKKKKVEPATKKSGRTPNKRSPNKKPRYAEDSEDDDDYEDGGTSKKSKTKKGRGTVDDNQENDNKEYEVEKILDVHQLRNGGKEYLVKWKGYPPSQSTWESEENVRHCPEIVKRFLKQLDDAKSKTPRETRVNPKHTDRFTLTMGAGGRRISKRNQGKQRTRYDDNE